MKHAVCHACTSSISDMIVNIRGLIYQKAQDEEVGNTDAHSTKEKVHLSIYLSIYLIMYKTQKLGITHNLLVINDKIYIVTF